MTAFNQFSRPMNWQCSNHNMQQSVKFNVLTNNQYDRILGKHIPGSKPCLSRNLFPNPCISQFLCAPFSPLCTLHYCPQIHFQS